jgi:hypothetical protein
MKIVPIIGRKKFKELELALALKYPPRTKKHKIDLVGISEAMSIKYQTLYSQWVRGCNMHLPFAKRLLTLI